MRFIVRIFFHARLVTCVYPQNTHSEVILLRSGGRFFFLRQIIKPRENEWVKNHHRREITESIIFSFPSPPPAFHFKVTWDDFVHCRNRIAVQKRIFTNTRINVEDPPKKQCVDFPI